MKSNTNSVIIPAIAASTFMVTQWLINFHYSDLLAGAVMGIGIGAMLVLLKAQLQKSH